MIDLDSIELRLGLANDKPFIDEICKNIWNGRDYLPAVWNNWLADDNGRFIIAELNGNVVGVYHLYNFNSDSWIEALRIKETHRRHGVANYLVQDAIDRSGSFNNLSLVTSIENIASLNLFKKFEFKEKLHTNYMSINPDNIQESSNLTGIQIIDNSDELLSIIRNHSIDKKFIPLWWRWWSLNENALLQCFNNGIAVISKHSGIIDSLLFIQRTKIYGHKDYSQLFILFGGYREIKNSLYYIKTSFKDLLYPHIFCFPESNSDESQILTNLGFNTGTNLVILEKSFISI